MSKTKFTKEEQEDLDMMVERMDNPYSFEYYCGACDHFNNPDECPFHNKVTSETRWEQIGCKNFWD